jgi:hypothetical protein
MVGQKPRRDKGDRLIARIKRQMQRYAVVEVAPRGSRYAESLGAGPAWHPGLEESLLSSVGLSDGFIDPNSAGSANVLGW